MTKHTVRFHLCRETRVRCQNCNWAGPYSDAQPDIPDIAERIEPGEIVPACECPKCGALCHIADWQGPMRHLTNRMGLHAIRFVQKVADLAKEGAYDNSIDTLEHHIGLAVRLVGGEDADLRSDSDKLVESMARMSPYKVGEQGSLYEDNADDAFDTMNNLIAKAKEIKGDLCDDEEDDPDFAEVGEVRQPIEDMTDAQVAAELHGNAVERLAVIAKKPEGPRVWLVQAWHWENPTVRRSIHATEAQAEAAAAEFVNQMVDEINKGRRIMIVTPDQDGIKAALAMIHDERGPDADVEITPMVLEGCTPLHDSEQYGWMLPL